MYLVVMVIQHQSFWYLVISCEDDWTSVLLVLSEGDFPLRCLSDK